MLLGDARDRLGYIFEGTTLRTNSIELNGQVVAQVYDMSITQDKHLSLQLHIRVGRLATPLLTDRRLQVGTVA